MTRLPTTFRALPARALALRMLGYLAGCLVFATGASLFIHSELGSDPLDVLALGLKEHIPLTIGLAQALIALVCIAIWSAWNRRRPVVAPFVTFFLCGSMIDLLLLADLSWLADTAALGVGVLLCAYGSALIIMSGIGIRAMDLVVITLVRRWGWPFWLGKAGIEAVLLATGWVLGGPVGVGTVCFLVFVDGLIQPFMALNRRALGMHNHGLDEPAPAAAPQGAA
ncbi:YitT family protein [Streptomyces sp. JJ36]|uniref:YczE/YyaS/YitT family protein n=1 Tax=Streptomyces sp. JJ36 TaxID=2736645 RepID=UPI001F1C4B83|nr:hypothetical protein [Streptomyces sp. JJ36]MCF6524310.1 hypothetical protein [Streptomyces sp. JJ36]